MTDNLYSYDDDDTSDEYQLDFVSSNTNSPFTESFSQDAVATKYGISSYNPENSENGGMVSAGQKAGVGQIVYHSSMAVALRQPQVTASEAVKQGFSLTNWEAEKKIATYNGVKNYYDADTAEQEANIAIIRNAKTHIKVGTEAYRLSYAVSEFQDAESSARTKAKIVKDNIEVRGNMEKSSEARRLSWEQKGQQATAKIKFLSQQMEGEDLTENQSDREYVV